MKHLASIHALLAALCLAAPVTGLASPDGPGDFHGRYVGPGFHGRYYHRGPRFFYGGAPVFWGPAVGFSFCGSPGYYSPGYYDDATDRPTYRGVPHPEADARDAKDAKEDLGVDVQRSLAQQGYYHGPLDGEIGSGSRAAIRAYQADHGLEATGRIDGALLHSLHID
jgi:Putative peptidoglycan binding domain